LHFQLPEILSVCPASSLIDALREPLSAAMVRVPILAKKLHFMAVAAVAAVVLIGCKLTSGSTV
jgi:hypothetical protein